MNNTFFGTNTVFRLLFEAALLGMILGLNESIFGFLEGFPSVNRNFLY